MTPPCPSKTSTPFAFSLNPPLPSFLFHSITPPPPLSLGNYCNGLAVPGGGEEDLVGGQLGERGVGTVRESDLWFSSDMLLAFGTDAHCANGRAPALCSLLFITETTVDHKIVLIRGQFYLKSEIHASLMCRCVPNMSAAHLLTPRLSDSGVNIILRHATAPHCSVNSWLTCAALAGCMLAS